MLTAGGRTPRIIARVMGGEPLQPTGGANFQQQIADRYRRGDYRDDNEPVDRPVTPAEVASL
jgi:hypothetical protein